MTGNLCSIHRGTVHVQIAGRVEMHSHSGAISQREQIEQL
jgi:hypothetical protein